MSDTNRRKIARIRPYVETSNDQTLNNVICLMISDTMARINGAVRFLCNHTAPKSGKLLRFKLPQITHN